jgi:hypothetical protein
MNFRLILWTVGMGYATLFWPAAMVLPHSDFSEQPSAMASGVCSPAGLAQATLSHELKARYSSMEACPSSEAGLARQSPMAT